MGESVLCINSVFLEQIFNDGSLTYCKDCGSCWMTFEELEVYYSILD